MDQLEERISQIDQLKNVSKRLQHRVDHILNVVTRKVTSRNIVIIRIFLWTHVDVIIHFRKKKKQGRDRPSTDKSSNSQIRKNLAESPRVGLDV